MLVTEKVAKEKWCQETFHSTRVKCVGSQCMAWRWSESIPHVCTKCGTEETEWKDEPTLRRGYCGLAGITKW
ncbi:MAG TPA: hypothetical protein DCP92_24005 [Nitrospiraceae bacterium]|nr:hypothetical protein [Nitrospiraceae bacterium]